MSHRNPNRLTSLLWILLLCLMATSPLFAGRWLQQESEHFVVIYRPAHAYLVPHILESAELALANLRTVFDYQPSEKIIINTYDFSDYGSAGTTTVPVNFIRLQIEPLELGYESSPFNERFQWLIGHELVHIVVNDQATAAEKVTRAVFSKVSPESTQPMTIFYSLLTNHARYSPRWHQEGIAVFMETWLSGGYGRVLGNFDEMYFRSMAAEGRSLPSANFLDAKISYESFLVETLFYLYGARFNAYLAANYGYRKLIDWYTLLDGDFYRGFHSKFKKVFGVSMEESWQAFALNEAQFQQKNLQRLQSAPLTPLRPLKNSPLGWVTSAFWDSSHQALIYGFHHPHRLTTIERLHPAGGRTEDLGSLPTPTILQISSTAFDPELQLYFYTVNNNKLYRDLWVLSTDSGKRKMLFQDCRVGQITVSPKTHELWGIRHQSGKTILVYSAYPYRELLPVVEFATGDNLQQLSVSPDGNYLSASMHRASGQQSLILADIQYLREGKNFTFSRISSDGSPEYPSWSPDGKMLYWSAYPNGVSNIYRYDMDSKEILAMSHTLRGLFKPVYLSADTLFAFEFTTEGFRPVLLPNRPAEHLPAIHYYGQEVYARNPELADLVLPETAGSDGLASAADPAAPAADDASRDYHPLRNLHFHSIIPVVTGFQSQIAAGIFTHITDPLYEHNLTVEAAVTPKKENRAQPRFHFKSTYEYRHQYKLGIEHNAPDFYDLFSDRKRGMIGNKFTAAYNRFIKYDVPHQIKHDTEIALYTGIQAINDNLVRVSRPDFFVGQSVVSSTNLRRAIGSVDSEEGTEWNITAMFFGVDPRHDLQVVGGVHAELGYFFPWVWDHNVLHLKLYGGIRHTRPDLSIGRYYFGGFGNRFLESARERQYRSMFRLPGIPIYSLDGDRFIKGMVEHDLPPIRPGKLFLGEHYLNHISLAWYAQGLWLRSPQADVWGDVGGQIDLVFKHWFNLESTLSLGVAQAWSAQGNSHEWFISFKLLKN